MKALLKRRLVYAHKHKRSRMRRRVTSLGISFTILLAVSFTAAGIANARRRAAESRSPQVTANTDTTGAAPHAVKGTSSQQVDPPPIPSAEINALLAEPAAPITACSNKKVPDNMLASSTDTHIRKLTEYDAAMCGGSITSSLIFIDMPQTNDEADVLARDLSSQLSSFAAARLAPFVIVEPQSGGKNLDMANLQSSGAVSVYEYFLTSLKDRGVTDEQAGTWVFFPEPNIPEWSTLDPAVFTTNVTLFGTLFKEYFKTSKLSVLLDSTTYYTNSYDASGSRVSLLPYVSGLPAGLVDSFGYQGFPWAPAANETGPASTDAADFLKPSLAVEAARSLGVNDIWLNTGSFARFYTNDSAKTVKLSGEARAKIMEGISDQAASLQKNGFQVSLTLFAEDKSRTNEAVDWSYWPSGKSEGAEGAAIFSNFAGTLHSQGISLGVFDTY